MNAKFVDIKLREIDVPDDRTHYIQCNFNTDWKQLDYIQGVQPEVFPPYFAYENVEYRKLTFYDELSKQYYYFYINLKEWNEIFPFSKLLSGSELKYYTHRINTLNKNTSIEKGEIIKLKRKVEYYENLKVVKIYNWIKNFFLWRRINDRRSRDKAVLSGK